MLTAVPFYSTACAHLLSFCRKGHTQKFSTQPDFFTGAPPLKADWEQLPRYGRVKASPVLLALRCYHFEKPLGLQEECENVAAFPANIWFPLPWIISLLPPALAPTLFLLFPHFILKVHQTLFFLFNIFLKLPSLNLLGSVIFLVIHYLGRRKGQTSWMKSVKNKTRREKHLSSVGESSWLTGIPSWLN